MKKILFFAISLWAQVAIGSPLKDAQNNNHYDAVVYGASPAGVTASIQLARMGKRVALISTDSYIGGIIVEGLGGTDIDNHASFKNSSAVGGLALEFFRRVAEKYGNTEALETAIKMGKKQPQLWRYEPHVAKEIIKEWVINDNISVFHNCRIIENERAVKKENTKIQAIEMEDGRIFSAKVFIDATIEGDLLARAGITTTIGRESNMLYNEVRNGVTIPTKNEQFKVFVDPYRKVGNPKSGLLPLIQEDKLEGEGGKDHRIQGYCFRVCLTTDIANQLPITKPTTYDRNDYTLFLRYLRAGGKLQVPKSNIPNGKTDFNGGGDLSHNFFGINHEYPAGSYAKRKTILKQHRELTQGLLYFFQNDPEIAKIDSTFQLEWKKWGLAKDEFADNAGWPRNFYVRDARRMVSDYVISEQHVRRDGNIPVEDPIAIAYWPPDVHAVRRIVIKDTLYNEGAVFGGKWWSPFGISYRSIIPRQTECENLLTPTCPSSSHIAYGALRLEWTFMAIGQAAGAAAALAIDQDCSIQQVSYEMLAKQLKSDHAVIQLDELESPETLENIAASQRGSSPLLFEVNAEKAGDLKLSDFNSAEECDVRRGLPHFFEKVNSGEDITIAFIGGSLTQANFCYRLQISNFIQQQYPQAKFKWINAGISGTGTDLGAFRIEEQVLSQNPDLVFIDFAVNGAYVDGMEGIVRQIIKHNIRTDICFIYAILGSHTASYQQGKVPLHIRNLEQLADHYGIPSVNMGMESAYLEEEGKLVWKGNETEAGAKILFSNDGIHPLKKGGDLYAIALARSILKMSKQDKKEVATSLPSALHTELWDEAHMYSPREIASFDHHWRDVVSKDSHLKMFSGWFDTLTTAYQAQATCSFSFEGDLFGLFDIGGPEVGQLEIWVDGKKVKLKPNEEKGFQFYRANEENGDFLLNRFNKYCNNRYRGQYSVITVPYGIHHVRYVISSLQADKAAILGNGQQQDILSHPVKYDQNVIYLGRILLRGKPLKLDNNNKI